MRQITFFANEDQLDQLRYALVDRVLELEKLLAGGDCQRILQTALEETLQLSRALKIEMDRPTVKTVDRDFSR